MKDARLINCVFLFPRKNSLQLTISKYSDRAAPGNVLLFFILLYPTTQMTLRNIRLLLRNITESHIRDRITKDTFKFTSPATELMQSQMAPLVKRWKLLLY